MNKQIMQGVIEYAIKNIETGGGPFAAAIVKTGTGRILSLEGNAVTKNNDPTAHAEIQAIRELSSLIKTFDLSGYEIYSSCEPCPMCLGAIYWAKLDNIYYAATRYDAANIGFDDSLIYDELSKNYKQRKINTIKINIDCRLQPFRKWENYNKKIEY